jgi:DNA-binding transcriptional regulator YdaS (Cro superfamily)
MSKPSPQMNTLSLALRACGGEVPLAKALGVSAGSLAEWLAGRGVLPAELYLKARALAAGRR